MPEPRELLHGHRASATEWPPPYVPHGTPPCICDRGGELPQCPSHGYEAVIARTEAERDEYREALETIAAYMGWDRSDQWKVFKAERIAKEAIGA